MMEKLVSQCPECGDNVEQASVDRRHFMQTVAGSAAVLSSAALVPQALAAVDPPAAQPARQAKPAEAMIRELFAGLSAEQRRQVVLPWDHGAQGNAIPTRLRMVNAPHTGTRIGAVYTPAQQELIERILRSISSGDAGMRCLTRAGTYDASGSLAGCGAHIFGDPSNNGRFSYVFSGHHITVRCDGNSEPNAAFGGPMYYGHTPDGYSQRNVFNYQTRAVVSVWEALNAQQRERAVVVGTPGEQAASVRFRPAGERHPGIPAADLSADQRALVQTVMREVLSPFRSEDADEVMQIIRRNGGLERIHLAFYRDRGEEATSTRWHFWRLEGPGFVWNYRVLPHVHTFVNIVGQA